MKNIKLLVAYEGTAYLGWQKTSMGPSIEQTLEEALTTVLQEKVTLQAASRTDRGVHAQGQVVNFFTAKEDLDFFRIHNSLNALLPKDICIKKMEPAPYSFHPTLDCMGKEYRYYLCTKKAQMPLKRYFSWHYPYTLDLAAMRQAALFLLGEQDFSAFSSDQDSALRSPLCILQKIVIQEEEELCISITGNRFLYRMARTIVGTLVYVGRGKIPPSSIPRILQSKDRKQAGLTAPAHGLVLQHVFYSLPSPSSSMIEEKNGK